VSDVTEYSLGYSEHEAQRLANQAARLAEFTEDVLRRAGIAPGMRVLDIGSGVGDVSLLLARMVLGVEKSAGSVETATRRAVEQGAANVAFIAGDIAKFVTDQRFDAIVGRFVLAYVPERGVVLEKLVRYLVPGGIVASLEIDMSQIAQVPPSDLFTRARQWVLEAFAAGGTELDMGSRLLATFSQAGLPEPAMIAAHPVVGGASCPGYEELAQGLRSLLPVIEREEIASAREVGIDTLAERLRADAEAHDRVLFMSRVVGAWTRLSPVRP
jgi:cyclopropane fatty-acyl-phospholipid synthase-like methyltransferase